MKRFLLAAVSLASMVGVSIAANLPLFSNSVDTTNELAILNTLIQVINGGVAGMLATLPASVTSTGTSKVALFSSTLPGNQLTSVGQVFHEKAVGVNSADANVKTLTFDFGAISCALVMTGSGNTWSADFWVTMTGAATENYSCTGLTGTTVVASVQGTGTVALNAAVAADVSATAATSGTMTLSQAWMDQIK